ncbi:alpha/beta hydrolase [Streptacidiphilus jiangxiensis]|uniref:Alpha/beta hydrolase n=1 Tax=Streptacidiphilus jiangxiensis TaxID=235985 RepID=A0A1H7V8G1_STRJI|nr:alpha/beta hydrolase [Streptacidiphilus jiangxiensis]SEM05533.1 Alpha/beta hydrolase [Streptacidiphilus jiangxiensis]
MATRPNVVRRLRRGLLAAAVAACVAVPLAGAAKASAVPAPVPAVLGPLTAGGGEAELTHRYAANRADIVAAEAMAAQYGDTQRAAELSELAGPDRQFLSFDGRDGGRTVEVFGNLATARTVAVLVPGSDTSLSTYDRFAAGAQALEAQLGGNAAHAAVVAWLGYATPDTVSPVVLTDGRADEAAPVLDDFVHQLQAFRPAARTSLVCHSYGSTVCARAASGLHVADLVLYGSPGVGSDIADVSDLHTTATVWAGRAGHDWIANVPHVRVPVLFTTLGLGTDPVSPGFGAHLFAAGNGSHSDYLKPGSTPLRSIASIVSGAADSTAPTHAAS